MNIKISKKDLKNNYYYIVKGGYCEYQHLTKYSPKFREAGYARGVYGWNWTAYSITATNGEEIVICTGYRDTIGKRIKGLEKFEKNANDILHNYSIPYEKRQKMLEKNAIKFADYIVKNYDMED